MMTTMIAGHKLTDQQINTLDAVLDYMRLYSGDTGISATTSPAGNGRWVPVTEIFPARNNQDNGKRRIVDRLAKLGILKAREITYYRGCLKAEPVFFSP